MRKFLTNVLPLVLPFLLYGIYLTLARRKASAAGAPAPPGWQDAPWVWIASAGMALLIVSLFASAPTPVTAATRSGVPASSS